MWPASKHPSADGNDLLPAWTPPSQEYGTQGHKAMLPKKRSHLSDSGGEQSLSGHTNRGDYLVTLISVLPEVALK